MHTSNYIREFETEVGLIILTYVFNENGSFNYVHATVNGSDFELNKTTQKQTSNTIIKKICKAIKSK